MKGRCFVNVRYFLFCSLFFMIVLGFAANNTYATNGYFANGYSIESKAFAGAGVALPQGSLDASINPAAMAFVGKRIDVGLSFFNPNREYKVSGNPSPPPAFGLMPGTVESESKWFVVPSVGINWPLDDKNSIGLSIYGNGGMNSDYDTNTFYGSSPTGVDLMQLFITPTYARKLAPKHAVAISPIFAYQSFEVKGLEAFSGYSNDPSNLTNNGHDSSYGIGGKIGYLGEILPNLNLGASYQTKIWMSRLDKYKGLFAEQGDFDIPATWTIGLAYRIIPALTVLVDVQEIYYSDVKSINNTLLPNLNTSQLGKDKGVGFGWDDITVLKLGIQWQSSKEWTWRAGYSIGDQPIPRSEVPFNILAPGVIKQHATAGFTKAIGDKQELKFALMYAFENDVTGKNPLDPGQKIKLTMNQWEISFGYAWKF
ncbi:MAG: outer membrane protein transport protein [Thermodesulfovibrionales bacterium]